jgi:hypothetical protein
VLAVDRTGLWQFSTHHHSDLPLPADHGNFVHEQFHEERGYSAGVQTIAIRAAGVLVPRFDSTAHTVAKAETTGYVRAFRRV